MKKTTLLATFALFAAAALGSLPLFAAGSAATQPAPAPKAAETAKPAAATASGASSAPAAPAAASNSGASSAPAASAAPAAPATAAAAPKAAAPAGPDTQSDEFAGKGADVSKIGHSPADGSPYLGAKEGLVLVNIFSDFQCPVCRRSADPMKQLVLDFPGAVKVVFRNNALVSHGRSKAAALAALAAGKQGKFWEFHDRLFANPAGLDDASLKRTATDLGLDVAQWEKDLADPKNAEQVARESAEAVKLGTPGTPAVFVNGLRVAGWGSYRGVRGMVEREISQGEKLAADGMALAQIPATRIKATAAQNPPTPNEGPIDPELWVRILTAN
jgi:protein-disulfide isomerase